MRDVEIGWTAVYGLGISCVNAYKLRLIAFFLLDFHQRQQLMKVRGVQLGMGNLATIPAYACLLLVRPFSPVSLFTAIRY